MLVLALVLLLLLLLLMLHRLQYKCYILIVATYSTVLQRWFGWQARRSFHHKEANLSQAVRREQLQPSTPCNSGEIESKNPMNETICDILCMRQDPSM